MRLTILVAASACALMLLVPASLAQTAEAPEPAKVSALSPSVATRDLRQSTVSSKNAPVVRSAVELQTATRATVAPNVTIAPRHVVEAQLAAKDGVFVPPGFEPVWDDDRLSLTRAHQTYSGQDQMSQFWDNTLPRRPVER